MIRLAHKSKIIHRNLPQNHTIVDDFFLSYLRYELPKMHIRMFNDIIVTSIGVLFKNFKPIAELDLPLPKKLINTNHFYLRHLIANLFKKRKVVKSKATFVVFANRNSYNYYHWLLESIPRLYVMREFIKDEIVVLPYFCNSTFHKEILSFFDVGNIEVIEKDVYYKIENVVTADYPAISSSHNPELLRNLQKHFLNQINNLNTPTHSENLFISRKPNTRRNVINKSAVEKCLLSHGFLVVYLEDCTFIEQVRIFYHAKIIVGIHGAGLSNLLFMRSGTVLELRASDQEEFGLCYYTLANAMGLKYYYQPCEPNLPKNYMHSSLIVDVELLKENLHLILNNRNKPRK